MKVTCEKCGEELLGAVNRCWRCGTVVASVASAPDLPPVRRAPVALSTDDIVGTTSVEPVGGTISDAAVPPTSDVVTGQTDSRGAGSPEGPGTVDEVVHVAQLLDGSRSNVKPPQTPSTSGHRSRSVPHPPSHSAHAGGAIVALVLGGMSFLFSYFTPLALVPAVVGLAMGIWGMYSTRRGLALAGVVLCCIALAISGFNGLVALYTLQHGHTPWAAPGDLEIYDEAYFDEKDDL